MIPRPPMPWDGDPEQELKSTLQEQEKKYNELRSLQKRIVYILENELHPKVIRDSYCIEDTAFFVERLGRTMTRPDAKKTIDETPWLSDLLKEKFVGLNRLVSPARIGGEK